MTLPVEKLDTRGILLQRTLLIVDTPSLVFVGRCIPLVKLHNGLDQCIMHVDIALIISRADYDT